MHPFIPAPSVALVEMVYTYAGQIIENTFHVKRGTPWDSPALQYLTQTLFNNWDGVNPLRFSGQRAGGCILTQIKGRALDTPSSPVYIYTLPSARAGAFGGTNYPANVTFCFTAQTGLAGRSYRGRIYMPGMTGSMIGGAPGQNLALATWANPTVTVLNDLQTQIEAHDATWHLVVTSYYNNLAWRTEAVSTRITNWAYADLAIDSQRRRLAFRGA